jgi:CRP/FNR family cyclic AMP-dependent transcriptional regulator
MPVSLQLLSQFPLLRPLQREILEPLSQRMSLREFARRAMVVSKEAPTQDLGFLVDGRLQGVDFTVDGRGVGLYFVEPGDYFGELPLVDGRAPSEYVVAAVKSTVAFLDAGSARDLITRHPELAQAVMKRLADRVRSVMAQRTLLSLPNPFQRLCALLLQLPRRQAGAVSEVEQAPTHQELAIMINASRETVTRAFQVLFLRGILVREGNALKLVNPQVLQDIAQGREEPPKG